MALKARRPAGQPQRVLSRTSRRMSQGLSNGVTKPLAAVTKGREYEVTKEEWDEAISDALF